jgi:hypothetical protein
MPLWQLAHPATIPLWFMVAPEKVTVLRWQVSQAALVGTCDVGFPGAVAPL